MLWYKSWLDTRWRFLLGLALLVIMACSNVFDYVEVEKLLPTIGGGSIGGKGRIGQAIAEALEVQQTYRGFVWYNWFAQGLTFPLFAALVGSGTPLARSGRGLLFTLALPAARSEWLDARVGVGLGQLLAFAVIPSLVYPLLSSVIGQQYGLGDALVHSACVFVAASVFFTLAVLLSTVFDDVWRPLLIACLAGLVLSFGESAVPTLPGLFAVMSAESYFYGGSLPWSGLLVSVVVSTALLYAARANIARREF